MATNKKQSDTKVTKISASDSSNDKKAPKTAAKSVTPKHTKTLESGDKVERNPLAGFFGYFTGSWRELKQVRWPNRRATWSLTGAVLAFSACFVVFILLLDAIFKYIFELILK